jgi:hypothetical protein
MLYPMLSWFLVLFVPVLGALFGKVIPSLLLDVAFGATTILLIIQK